MAARNPESPCNRHCTLDPDTDVCLGCYRTLEEILRWSAMSVEQRRTILAKLEDRRIERLRNRAR